MGLLTYILGLIVIVCIVVPLLGRILDAGCGNSDHFDITPTTNTEYMTLTVMETLIKNRDRKEDFEKFLRDLKKKGVVNQKIDLKFYTAASLAYRNGLLTRDYIANRLN